MANAYSKYVPTRPISQYVPEPVEMYGNLLQDARVKRDRAQLSDARTKQLLESVGGTEDPAIQQLMKGIEEKAMSSIAEREQKGYSSQDVIETDLLASEAARSIGSVQTAQQAVQNWEEEYRELNRENVDANTLNMRINALRPSLQYDEKSGTVKAASRPVDYLAPDVDLGAKLKDAFSDSELQDMGVDVVRDPRTGGLRIDSVEGRTPEHVLNVIDSALKSDPEVQQYLDRFEEDEALRAQLSGNPSEALNQMVNGIVSGLPEEHQERAKTEAVSRIENLRDRGLDDASIYGKLQRGIKIRQAENLGLSKYVFKDTDSKFLSASESKLNETIYNINNMDMHELVKPLNNPMLAGVSSSLLNDINSIYANKSRQGVSPDVGKGSVVYNPHTGRSYDNAPIEMPSINQILEDDKLSQDKKDMLSVLNQRFPQKERETNEQHIERIEKRYQEMLAPNQTMFGTYYQFKDIDDQADDRVRIIGDKNDDHVGDIRNRKITVMNDSGHSTDPMSFVELAKYLGADPGSADFKKQFMDRAGLVGIFKGDNPITPSGHYMVIEEGDGWFSNAKGKMFMVHDTNIKENARYKPLMEISKVRMNPTVQSAKLSIGGGEIEVRSKDKYVVEAVNGQPRQVFYADEATPEDLERARYDSTDIEFTDSQGNRISETGTEKERQQFRAIINKLIGNG